jgi:hypothetical protein
MRPPRHPTLGAPHRIWDYVLADGKPFCSVARWDLPAGKQIRPFYTNGAGVEWKRPQGIAPLFRLPNLLNGGARVLVVAGEKAADAAKRLFPGWSVTTSLGGEAAAKKTDWSGVRGKHVTFWPDNDDAGWKYFLEAQALCRAAGAAAVYLVEVPAGAPRGWDLADEAPDGWRLDELLENAVEYRTDAYVCGGWGNVPPRERAQFVWRPYVPLGEITVIAGPPGIGKGTVAADIVARVTTGRLMPFGDEMWAPGNVLWCETEDSASHTLAPRFEAARADKSRIRIAKIGDPLLADLRKTITENEVRMVVMSPFVSFLPGLEDANSELASRAVLQTLLYTVDGTKCAILGIMHPNKQVTAATLHRIMGSTAFVAFVRSVMVIGVKDDQKRLAHAKHNLTVRGKDLLYSITDTGANPDDGLICAEWSVAPDNCCVESLWNSKPEKRARTSDWLIAHLMLHGEQPANDVINAGIAAGYTAAAIMKACQRSRKVKSRREHYRGSWLWSVPDAE